MAEKKAPANSGQQRKPMPIGKPFQKGQSGNPSGRPKGLAEFQAMAREHTVEALQALAELLSDEDKRVRVAAVKEMLDRGWGKAAQAITDADGQSLGAAVLLYRLPNNGREAD